jgi:NHL repeat
MSARRSISMVLVSLCAAAGGLLLCGAPASAQRLHVFSSSFGSEGSGPGQFLQPGALAVNDATGDVYVIDRGNARVEVFNSKGEYLSAFNGSATPAKAFGWAPGKSEASIAVDNSTSPSDPSRGDVYVVDTGHGVIDKFTADGVYIDQVTLPAGTPEEPRVPVSVAVDASGMLWVESYIPPGSLGKSELTQGPPTFVYELNDASANELVREVFPSTPPPPSGAVGGAGVIGLAVDSEGSVYMGYCPNYFECFSHVNTVNEKEEKVISLQLAAKFTNGGGFVSDEIDGEGATGLALDGSSNDLYVDNNTSIAAFTPAGAPIERFGSPQLSGNADGIHGFGEDAEVGSEGVAVNSATGTVYASDAVNQEVFIFTAFVVPDVSTGSVSNLGETSATANGVVNPDGLPVSACVFEYGTTTSYGQEAACSPSPGSGSAPVAVSAKLSGLEPLRTYHFRLKVANANGSEVGQDQTFLTPEPVGISEETVSDVSSTSALFSAQVDAGGSSTSFHFEYGPSVAYGESVPVPDGEVGGGVSGVPVSVRPEDLAPGTAYHVRLVASNALGVVYGPDEVFTTLAAGEEFALPDGREWEMVSPVAKYGAAIEPLEHGLVESAEGGSAITYPVSGPIEPNPAGNPTPAIPVQVLSRRGAGGWSTEEIALPRGDEITGSADVTGEYRWFSGELSSALVEPLSEKFDRLLSPEATGPTPYLRDNDTGSYLPLVTAGDIPAGTPSFGLEAETRWPHVVAATPDLSHVLLSSPFALAEKAKAVREGSDEQNLYEWSGRRLQLVNVLPGGEAATDGFVDHTAGITHEVSDDGSKVFWQGPGGALYMRDTVAGQTVQIDASPPGSPASFSIASADGSKVFFTENGDLYVYDTATETPTDLTGGASGGEPGEVQGEVLGASEGGSVVYFVAKAALAEGAQAGGDNLYVASETGAGWSLRLVAVLSPEDEKDWSETPGSNLDNHTITSRVSPNGRFLAFMSERSLTGYDNRDLNSGVPDEEVFLYDEAANRLVCASCNPTGERPTGMFDDGSESERTERPLADHAAWWRGHWLAAIIPGSTGVAGHEFDLGNLTPYQQRYLSDEGRLFFDGFDALAPQATNGKANVYEYEPQGVGSCTRVGGCIGLLSSGTSSEESAFMDASENGNDVFFLTASQLVAQDVETSLSLYDAHLCSAAEPCVSVPVSPPACSSGDACKAAPSPQPAIFGAPASATFSGTGNLLPAAPAVKPKAKPAKCKSGFSAKKDRCVRKPRPKKKRKAAKSSRGGKK